MGTFPVFITLNAVDRVDRMLLFVCVVITTLTLENDLWGAHSLDAIIDRNS